MASIEHSMCTWYVTNFPANVRTGCGNQFVPLSYLQDFCPVTVTIVRPRLKLLNSFSLSQTHFLPLDVLMTFAKCERSCVNQTKVKRATHLKKVFSVSSLRTSGKFLQNCEKGQTGRSLALKCTRACTRKRSLALTRSLSFFLISSTKVASCPNPGVDCIFISCCYRSKCAFPRSRYASSVLEQRVVAVVPSRLLN